MNFRFTILASGSTGNAAVIEMGDCRLLIDAGLSAKKLDQLMQAREIDPKKLQAILVTHEHSDHIKGLGAFARKHKLPIYANERTWTEMESAVGELEAAQRQVAATGGQLSFGDIAVESFAISHDAAEPVGYTFKADGMKLSFATDLGYVSPNVKEKIADSDVLVLEANHDIEMLRVGRYPWNVKRRILGDKGHLSNDAAADTLIELLEGRKTRRVYLAHLSQDHNMLELARMTVEHRLNDSGISLNERKLRLMDTYYDRPTAWDWVSEE